MKKDARSAQWWWLLPLGVCLVLFVVSLPLLNVNGVPYNLYGFPIPPWSMLGTILSLGGFFISGFLFLKDIYL